MQILKSKKEQKEYIYIYRRGEVESLNTFNYPKIVILPNNDTGSQMIIDGKIPTRKPILLLI